MSPAETDLKTQYFPDLPNESEKMAWMRNPVPALGSGSEDSGPRFDLSGRQLSTEATRDLPSDMGLHHHGSSPELAGYTLDDILHLCQSTVPSQRITMMGVLSRIISSYVQDQVSSDVKALVVEKRICETAASMAVGCILLMSKSAGIFRAGIDLFYESLGGSNWTWMEEEKITPFQPKEAHVEMTGVAWEDVVPTFGEMLATDSLAPRTTTQILRIMRRLAVLSDEHCELVTPLIPEIIRSHVLLRQWPSTSQSTEPSIEALDLMNDTIVSSRRCAAALVDQGIIESLLKFPLTLTWDDTLLGRELTQRTLVILGSLARYGLATSIAKSGAEALDRLRTWLKTSHTSPIVTEYMSLLRAWTVCATDPHKTTPEHDLTWAQVSAMGWIDDATGFTKTSSEKSSWEELASGLAYVAVWLEGAEVNEVEKGAEEKSKVLESLQAINLVDSVLGRVQMLDDAASTSVIAQLMRIHALTGSLFSTTQVQTVVERFSSSTDPLLRYRLLSLSPPGATSGTEPSVMTAFEILPMLGPGLEPFALDLVDTILRSDHSGRAANLESLPSDGLEILRPLLHYTILPGLTNVVGPSIPRPDYLKATSTLRPAPLKSQKERRGPGLPLGHDWIFSPLDELLHSATSAALAQTPPDWDPSELDLVRATLMLAQIRISHDPAEEATTTRQGMSRSDLLLNLMKVFMLEHGQQTPTNHSETDLFRDPVISQYISALLSRTTSTCPTSVSELRSKSLEEACISFLGPETPFFQWYSDFLALYESISFGDQSFTQLLLAPLAMNYAVDYRQIFWDEHTPILRGMSIQSSQVPLEDPRGLTVFYEPVETDGRVLDGMVRAAGKGWLREGTFMRDIAIHHLGSAIWSIEHGDEGVQKRLLVGVLSTCQDPFVEALVRSTDEAERTRRREVAERLAGPRGRQRLDKLGL